jgi:hypothetical protein
MGHGGVQTTDQRRRMMKHALTAASLVLVAGLTAGCGGGNGGDSGGAKADASEKDFCANFQAVSKDLGTLGANAKDADIIKAVKAAGRKIEETGTPKGISDDARKGFEVETKLIDDLDSNATKEDLGKMDSSLSATEKKQVQAFDKYVSDTCKM